MIVWDRGPYENLRDEPIEEALDAGHASFWLEGEKLHGGWCLRRIEGRRWLLVSDATRRRTARPGRGAAGVGGERPHIEEIGA